MKRINWSKLFIWIMCLVFCVSFWWCVGISFAGEKQIALSWQKEVLEADLDKFIIEFSVTGGEGALDWQTFFEIAYSAGVNDYVSQQTFTSPDGQKVQYWFRVKAMDISANSSDWCYGDTDGNDCTTTIDFEPPGTTINFTVTVVEG